MLFIFQAWSNDRIHSALHGVKMRGNKERFSVTLFSHKNGMTHVPEELVDDEHPLKFKPFNNFEMIRFHFAKEGQATNHTAKAFCGIYNHTVYNLRLVLFFRNFLLCVVFLM